MIYSLRKYSALLFPCALSVMILIFATTKIATSSNSSNSLSISSNRSENSHQYLVEIFIEGIDASNVTFETDFQTLYLLAQRGSVISEFAIAGSQVIRLAFDFPANANLKNYFRVNKANKIIISIPKS